VTFEIYLVTNHPTQEAVSFARFVHIEGPGRYVASRRATNPPGNREQLGGFHGVLSATDAGKSGHLRIARVGSTAFCLPPKRPARSLRRRTACPLALVTLVASVTGPIGSLVGGVALSGRLSKLTTDEATATAHADDPITIGKRTWSREDAPAILGEQLDFLPRNVRHTTRVPVGIYRGLRFGMVLHPQFPPDVYLEGAITRRSTLSREHQGPRAVLNALERLATAYGSECVRVQQDFSIAEAQLRDYQARLGKPFLHEAYLSQLTELRDQLKAGLSATTQMQGDEAGPSVSEMAEKIKTLKAAHSIEATPQRARQKHSSAEEPVTARIRRRQEAHPVSDQAIGHEATESPAVPEDFPAKPLTFQERIAMERQRRDQRPSLS
jgi:hypothetical protein